MASEENAPTLEVGIPGKPRPRFTAAEWDRYELLELIGEGGMGQVFRAYDPRLRRHVALKFLSSGRADLAQRFLREAQAQARLTHENVCRVHEVGEALGRPYIAMELIDGRTLSEAAPDLSLAEKIDVMREVADAVHAAHRIGLIHRDLKPSNIMLERRERGGWKPYVLDFGLAREATTPGLTLTGEVIGTPQYMAPEQARSGAQVDARSDVWALGATLFRVVAGREVFAGTVAEVLARLLDEDPPLLRAVCDAPADLETIVARCLERDPARRYPTARALGEDLARFRDGETVLARAAGWRWRARRWARRRRGLLLAAAVVLAGAGASAAMLVRARRAAAEQAALAQRFGQEAQEIEGLLRRAYALPLHDVRAERDAIRARLRAVAVSMGELGAVAVGPGEHALGRGLLLLDDVDAARAHLERAWAAGYRTPAVAYSLGQALGAIYGDRLEALRRVSDPVARERRRAELVATVRDPALARLRDARGRAADPVYLEAQIAFFEERWDDAMAGARTAFARAPWLYEAKVLEGQVFMKRARERQNVGDDAGAAAAADAAGAAFEIAADIARSDPRARASDCTRWAVLMDVRFDEGKALDDAYRQAQGACGAALVADPGYVVAYHRLAVAHQLWARQQRYSGRDPDLTLALVLELCHRGLALDPADDGLYNERGIAFLSLAKMARLRRRDPRAYLERAAEAFGAEIRLTPEFYAPFSNLGQVQLLRGEAEHEAGRDSGPALEAAAAALGRAAELAPRDSATVANLAIVHATRADHEIDDGRDPRGSISEALAAYARGAALNPRHAQLFANQAQTLLALARWERGNGGDASATLARAEESAARALAIKPEYGAPQHLLGEIARERGAYAEARARLRRARELDANLEGLALSEIALELADPAGDLAVAERGVRAGLAADPDDEQYLVAAARLAWVRAGRRGAGARDLDAGLAAAARALARNPRLVEALALRGALELAAGRPGDAAASLTKALAMGPQLRVEFDVTLRAAQAADRAAPRAAPAPTSRPAR